MIANQFTTSWSQVPAVLPDRRLRLPDQILPICAPPADELHNPTPSNAAGSSAARQSDEAHTNDPEPAEHGLTGRLGGAEGGPPAPTTTTALVESGNERATPKYVTLL